MKSIKVLLLSFLGGLFISCNAQLLSSIITTESGKVEGTIENGIKVFKGIPFAAPPVGDLRWKAPQPVKPWEGVRKADKFAPGSIQNQKIVMEILQINSLHYTRAIQKNKLLIRQQI
jgi:para-nitrobenzyl esterase